MSSDLNFGQLYKPCARCANWHPEGQLQNTIRHGGKCNLNNKNTKMNQTCWGFKECSPNQFHRRRQAGLIKEAE